MDTLIWIALHLWIALGRMDILTILILPIQEYGILLPFLCIIQLHQFGSIKSIFYTFQSIGLSLPWLSLSLCILFFLLQL